MKLTDEQLKKARNAKSVEEIISIAKAENIDLTKEQAENYFKSMHIEGKGKVSDEELENVTGGTCYSKGKGVVDPVSKERRRYAIVSPLNICPDGDGYICMNCQRHFIIKGTWYCSDRWWENGREVRGKKVY